MGRHLPSQFALTEAAAKKFGKARGSPATIKKAIKKFVASPPVVKTDVVRPSTPAPATQAGLKALQTQLQADIALIGKKRPDIPILTGLGPAGGVLRTAAIAGSRLLLRAPGTRQAAEQLAGRATTLKPLLGRGPSLGQAATFAGGVLAGESIISGAAAGIDLLERRFEGPVRAPTQERGLATMQHGTGRSLARLPAVGGMLPPGTTIVKTWNTGTAQFARLADGRIAVQRKDGTIKVYRPPKHIVIPRNPRVGTLIRADKRLDRLVKGLRKAVRSGKR